MATKQQQGRTFDDGTPAATADTERTIKRPKLDEFTAQERDIIRDARGRGGIAGVLLSGMSDKQVLEFVMDAKRCGCW